MGDFTERKLEQSSGIGEECKRKRKEKKLSLQEVSRATSVQVRYLEAIEEGSYDVFPARVYAINFLKGYARFLGLDEEQAVISFTQEMDVRDLLAKKHIRNTERIRPHLGVTPATIKRLIVASAGVLILVYLFFQFLGVVRPPVIHLSSPESLSMETHESATVLKGRVERGSALTVNEESVYINETGEFEKEVLLGEGTNIFELVSTNRFNKERILRLKITRILSFHD